MPSPVSRLALITLDGAFAGKAWQGPTLTGSLRGVDPALALWRPEKGLHCIWEQMLHATYWKLTILRVFDPGTGLGLLRSGSNWPELPAGKGRAVSTGWKEDLAHLKEVHAALRGAVAELPDDAWHTRPAKATSAAARSLTYAQYLAGAAAHDAYHTGQIRYIKRLYAGRAAR